MAASTSGAIKAFLEGPLAMGGAAIGVSVYRDQAPANTPLPYLTVSEAVAIVPDPLEDDAPSTVREHLTVDVFMQWKDLGGTGKVTEDMALPGVVVRALQGSRLMTSGSGAPATTVYGVLINSAGPRIVEIDANRVHFPVWVEVWRKL